jgi:hypothetical protein
MKENCQKMLKTEKNGGKLMLEKETDSQKNDE